MGRYSLAGAFGVPIFFLLSAYLIVSLLLREHESTGTINLRFFFIRRMLRIWPLYFVALIAGFAIGHWRTDLLMPRKMLASYILLAGNVYVARHGWTNSPSSVLWSLSVEEQFYLLIPVLAKFGGVRGLRLGCWAALLVSYSCLVYFGLHHLQDTDTAWVNSFVQFQYFAIGFLLAIWGKSPLQGTRMLPRVLAVSAGLLLFVIAAGHGPFLRELPEWLIFVAYYALGAIGSVAVFFGFLSFPARRKSWVAYLGVISYGLYVFHPWFLEFAVELVEHVRRLAPYSNFAADLLALAASVAMAACSYRYFEKPILKLKARFEIVRSRPV